MTDSIIYALISMLFAGATDTLLKRQAISINSQSQFMVVTGLVWSSVFIISAFIHRQYTPTFETLKWTMIIGTLSAFANYILIFSMRKLEAGVATTIYRLNLALAAIIAFIFLAESINFIKVFGLLLACSSVLCFTQHQKKIIPDRVWPMLFIVLFASLLRAIYGITYKIALARDIQYMWFLSGPGLGWIILGSMSIFNGGSLRISSGNLLRGTMSGFLLCGLVFFYAKAIEYGQASIVIPVSQMSFVITAILAWFFFGEKFSIRKIVGLFLAIMSILLLSQSS